MDIECQSVSAAIATASQGLRRFAREVPESRGELVELSAELRALDSVMALLRDESALPHELAQQTPMVVAACGTAVAELCALLNGDLGTIPENAPDTPDIPDIPDSPNTSNTSNTRDGLDSPTVGLFRTTRRSRWPTVRSSVVRAQAALEVHKLGLALVLDVAGVMKHGQDEDAADDLARVLAESSHLRARIRRALLETEAAQRLQTYLTLLQKHTAAALEKHAAAALEAGADRLLRVTSPCAGSPDSAIDMGDDDAASSAYSEMVDRPSTPSLSSLSPPPRSSSRRPPAEMAAASSRAHAGQIDEPPPTPPPRAIARRYSLNGSTPYSSGRTYGGGSGRSSSVPPPQISCDATPPPIRRARTPVPTVAHAYGDSLDAIPPPISRTRSPARSLTVFVPPATSFVRTTSAFVTAAPALPSPRSEPPPTTSGSSSSLGVSVTVSSDATPPSPSRSSLFGGRPGSFALSRFLPHGRASSRPLSSSSSMFGHVSVEPKPAVPPAAEAVNGAAMSTTSTARRSRLGMLRGMMKREAAPEAPEPDAVFGVSLRRSLQVASTSARTHHAADGKSGPSAPSGGGSSSNSRRGRSVRQFPLCVFACYRFLVDGGLLGTPGLFAGGNTDGYDDSNVEGDGSFDRVSTVRVRRLRQVFASGPSYGADLMAQGGLAVSGCSAHDAAALVLVFLAELPKPLVPASTARLWITMSRQATQAGSSATRRGLDGCIDFWEEALGGVPPGAARSLLKLLLNLLGDVADAADRNDMTAERLAGRVLRPLLHDATLADGVRRGYLETDYVLGLAFIIRRRSEYTQLLGGSGRASRAAF